LLFFSIHPKLPTVCFALTLLTNVFALFEFTTMRVAIASSLVAYAATVAGMTLDEDTVWVAPDIYAGLLVTYPSKGEKVDLSKPVTIEWQSVRYTSPEERS
jgi:hypothetical protein